MFLLPEEFSHHTTTEDKNGPQHVLQKKTFKIDVQNLSSYPGGWGGGGGGGENFITRSDVDVRQIRA